MDLHIAVVKPALIYSTKSQQLTLFPLNYKSATQSLGAAERGSFTAKLEWTYILYEVKCPEYGLCQKENEP